MCAYFKRTAVGLAAILAVCLALSACKDSFIFDDEGDCSIHYRVGFRYDYNMKFADAFAHEVKSVTLYVLDKAGSVVWQGTRQGGALGEKGFCIEVDVPAGEYDLMAWCGDVSKASFSVPQSQGKEALSCRLGRDHDLEGNAFVKGDIDRLYYGYISSQVFPDEEGVHEYTVPLMKDTNHFEVVLQSLNGSPIDKDKFTFTITDDNGYMAWDNSLLGDETLSYYAWNVDAGTADMQTRSQFSAVIAELTTARLVKGHNPRLTVSSNGKTVLSIPVIDIALLVKGKYNELMPDQEYLDRQDEYNFIFFLDDGERWMSSYIYINSWKVVLQNTGI